MVAGDRAGLLVMPPAGDPGSPPAFKVPVALDGDGRLIGRDDAVKGASYRCPACRTRLVFKAGQVRARHFAHAPTYACYPETVVHETAKQLIAQVVIDWATRGGPRPTVEKRCKMCFRSFDENLGRIDGAAVEHRLADGLVADVALMRESRAVAVVEVLVSHAVDVDKARRLTMPWLEVRGEDVVADPLRWKPVASGNVRPLICERCTARDRSAAELCRALGMTYDDNRYLAETYSCYRCHKKTPVFAWRREQLWETRIPPKPMPRTVEWRRSATLGRHYWANTCAHCKALLGDNFLFRDADSPFVGREELHSRSEEEEGGLLDLTSVRERLAAPRPDAVPTSPYETEVVRCRVCRAKTRYYSWDGEEPPEPRPDTVRLANGPAGREVPEGLLPVALPPTGAEWRNYCLHCDAELDP